VVIQPVEPVAEKFFGAFKIARWPEDLDEFMVRAIREWWMSKDM